MNFAESRCKWNVKKPIGIIENVGLNWESCVTCIKKPRSDIATGPKITKAVVGLLGLTQQLEGHHRNDVSQHAISSHQPPGNRTLAGFCLKRRHGGNTLQSHNVEQQ